MSLRDWSEAGVWDPVCDPDLRFQSQILVGALALWRRHAPHGSIPRRAALTLRALKSLTARTTLFERVAREPSRYRVRLMGTRIAQLVGEAQGRMLEDVIPPQANLRWCAAFDEVLSQSRPLRFFGRQRIDDLDSEILMAPLLDDAGRPNLLFTVATFRSGASVDCEGIIAARI
ncbi:MAG: PAS domain-containing protein [Alphaproteobacteria bacterium]|nr:PAS domain-containing protein [Alphaproteobacteria bacterium]